MDISVDFIAELGTTTVSINELLKFEAGSVIDLENQLARAWSYI